jgi:hypothetical protein
MVPLNDAPSSLFCSKCGAPAHYRCETPTGATATATAASKGCARVLCKACVYWLHYELAESTISTYGINGGLQGSTMSLLGALSLAAR